MNPAVLQIAVGPMANFTYIVADEENGEAAVIDPSWDLDKIFQTLKKNSWRAKYIINTHTHFDHVIGNEQMAEVTGAKRVQHKNSQLEKDIAVSDGDTIEIGSIRLRVLYTPGHSKDSICLLLDDQFVFTGDTLFVATAVEWIFPEVTQKRCTIAYLIGWQNWTKISSYIPVTTMVRLLHLR